jgi:hypothetical protein
MYHGVIDRALTTESHRPAAIGGRFPTLCLVLSKKVNQISELDYQYSGQEKI